MARPIKEGLDYFPHDVDCSTDDNIETIESFFGNDGYAVYFKLLERIYRNGGKIFIVDAETMQKHAKRFNISSGEKLVEIINLMVKVNLFDKNLWETQKCLTSNGITKRMQVVVDKRVRMKERSRQKYSSSETNVVDSETPIVSAESTQSKVKESKEKKRKALPPEKQGQVDPLKTIDEDIKNFKSIGMTDLWIKDHYLNIGLSESEIDAAMGKKF